MGFGRIGFGFMVLTLHHFYLFLLIIQLLSLVFSVFVYGMILRVLGTGLGGTRDCHERILKGLSS